MKLIQCDESNNYRFNIIEARLRLYTYETEIGVFDV